MPTITVNESTALVLTTTDADVNVYAETYFGHETGNTFAVPFTATPADVIDAYFANAA